MDWWQQYQGYFWVGLLLLLPIVGTILRRRVNRFSARAAENLRTGKVVATSGMPMAEKAIAELGTVVQFRESSTVVAPALAGMKLPFLWKQVGPMDWQLPVSVQDPTPSARAVLEDTPTGARLALVLGEESAGIILTDSPWRKIRRNAVKVAQTAGLVVEELAGPPLARVATVDTAGMTPAEVGLTKHRWERTGP
ncbi:hypothetical protein BH10ACT7_BH10ACT7_22430 [soil metagenome]